MSDLIITLPIHSPVTVWGFPRRGHVFAIRDTKEETLFEYLGHDRLMLEARPISSPMLRQVFTQHQFSALVAAGKVDPRISENDTGRQRLLALNPDIQSIRDLSEEERQALVFYTRLCRGVHGLYLAGKTSLSNKALEKTIRAVMAQLYLDADPDHDEPLPERAKGGIRGRKKSTLVQSERRLKARKRMTSFQVPSPTTVRVWIGLLLEYHWDELAIRDRRKARTGNRPPRNRDPVVASVMADWVEQFLDRSRPSAPSLYKLMIGAADDEHADVGTKLTRGKSSGPMSFAEVNAQRVSKGLPTLTPPSLASFKRAIAKLDAFEVRAARYGAADARRRFKIAGTRNAAIAAGERVSIDCWRFQLMAQRLPTEFWVGLTEEQIEKTKALRLTMCLAICEATKFPLGVRLSVNADAETSLRTLELVCRDKTAMAREAGCRSTWHQACSPESVPTDSGSEFIDTNFRAAVRDIGASSEVGPGAHPDARPTIERFFRTLDLQLSPFFQGRTFAGVSDRGDYDPAAFANVVVETLRVALVRYLVDVYANTPHGGLGGQTPADAWEEKTERYSVMPPPPPEVLKAVFGFADTRQIQHEGIRFFGLRYRSAELAKLRVQIGQAHVRIRADLQDLGSISVCAKRPGATWFDVPCGIDMAGVSLADWRKTAAILRQRHADTSRLREPIALAALRDIRLLGKASALQAGLGPSTMSRADVLREEEATFRHFAIATANMRGTALDGTEAEDDALHDDDRDVLLALTEEDDAVADELDDQAITGRRRDRLGSSFLTEEE